jgi:tetratricopeptide (TPR) repeat protein
LLLPLLVFPLTAQLMDTANGSNSPARTISVFDEIADPQERSLFRELGATGEPRQALQRATGFVNRYPRSIVLREAYETAARASAALDDDDAALDWGKRALRLLPENPFLLAMITDLAAQHGQREFAESSGRQALRYLEHALPPAGTSPADWPRARDDLRNQVNFALGRMAVEQQRYADAEHWLLDALRSKPADYVALYILGVERYANKEPDAAAPCFAEVMRSAGGASADNARKRLQQIYAAKPRSQTFDEFAVSERWSLPPAPSDANNVPLPGAYAGSAACRACHEAEFRNWQSTGMAKMFRPYSAPEVIGRFAGEEIQGGARAIAENGQRFIELRDADSGKWTRYKIDALIGSKWQQAYASLLPDGRLAVLPIQFSKLENGWVNYWKIVDGNSARSDIGHFQGVPDGALYQRDCAPCHTSQLSYSAASASPAAVQIREGGIDCEMCHGPSQAHVDAMRGTPSAPSRTQLPLDFKKVSAEESVAICAQCHMQSLAHDPLADGAVNYSPGSPFYRVYSSHLLPNYTHKMFYADGRFRTTTFIGEAFERSRCFLEGGATCVSCHNLHPDNPAGNEKSLKFAPDSDEMCLQCHQALRDRPEKHTRHAPASEASRCVSCHMPRNMEALLFRARSHQIDEIPDAAMTARFGETDSPNACLSCHRDKDVSWLTANIAAWRPAQ